MKKTINNLDVESLTKWLKTLNKNDFDRGVDSNLTYAIHIEELKSFHEQDKKHVKANEIVFNWELVYSYLY